ncbi:MAG: flippase [Candidatus Gracilibacteria bacterium]|jgi:O-antigen/teichoic acid export membrane protein|nr:flippase [Candidatus Gracilibacteria bacterium]
MSTARKILTNTVSQFVGKIAIALLGLMVVKICTNYLSLESYGEYVLIYEYLAFFGITADLGLFTIAVREMSKDKADIPKIIGNILSLRTIMVFLSMALASTIVFFIPRYEDTKIPVGVIIASFTTILTIINGTTTSVLQAKLKMHLASIGLIIGKIISVAFMGYIVIYGIPETSDFGFYMLIFAGTVGTLGTIFFTDHFVRKITPLVYRFDFDLWKDVLVKSLPYGIALFLNTLYFRVDSIMISFIRGQQEVGLYGVAMKTLEQFTVLPLYFMNSVLPVLTREIEAKSERYKTIIKQSFSFLSMLSVPMVVATLVLATSATHLVADDKFVSNPEIGFFGSDAALKILIFTILFQFLNVLFAFVLIALNKQTKLLYINAACVVFNVAGNALLIPLIGFRGAAITSVLSQLFVLIFNYYFAKKELPFSLDFKVFGKVVFASLIMGGSLLVSQKLLFPIMGYLDILPMIPIGATVYFAVIFLTKAVDKDTLKMLKKA